MADIDQLKKKVDEYYGEMKYKEIADCLEAHKVCTEYHCPRIALKAYQVKWSVYSESEHIQALQG